MAALALTVSGLSYFLAAGFSLEALRLYTRDLVAGFSGALIAFLSLEYIVRAPDETRDRIKALEDATSSLEKEVRLAFDDSRAFVVRASAIPELLEKCRQGTSYVFLGNSGSHFSSVTLAALAERSQGNQVEVWVQIINPACGAACDRFAKMKKYAGAIEAQRRLWATIILLHYYSEKFPKLSIKASMRDATVTVRVDMGNERAVLTTEGDRDPAFLCVADGLVYTRLREQIMELVKLTGKELAFKRGLLKSNNDKLADLDERSVRAVLEGLGFSPTAADTRDVTERVRAPKNPYASR